MQRDRVAVVLSRCLQVGNRPPASEDLAVAGVGEVIRLEDDRLAALAG
jgi:hypothetical protein